MKNESVIWWNLGPSDDEAQEVRQRSVCPSQSKRRRRKKKIHALQCVTVTAIHSAEP